MERPPGKSFFTDLGSELVRLYEELPAVSCTSCGKCCSSPHITFAEAAHLFEWLFHSKSRRDLETFFNSESISQKFEYNFKCRFEDVESKLCAVHPARGFICRVFGYPVLDRMGIENMDNCWEIDRPILPNVRRTKMHVWLDRLEVLNRRFAREFHRAPYFVTGLNVETWLDIAVTDYGRRPFREYHRLLNHLPFQELNLAFSDRTGLSMRLAKIDLFHQAFSRRDGGAARRILDELSKSEPMTGTFFRFEARQFQSQLASAA